jgi:quercetin dioxygenase-like cupin family protein
MKQPIALAAVFLGGLVVGAISIHTLHAQAPPYVTQQIFQTDANDLAGKEVLVFTSTWQPGARLPLHVHPNGHEVTYVIEGEQTFEIDGAGTKIVKAGEAIYVPPNTPHFGRNATDRPSKTVVFRLKDKNKPVMEEVKK